MATVERLSNSDRLTRIEELLIRGVDNAFNTKNIKKRLLEGETLRVKYGIDPTSENIHIGRMVPVLKLRDLQELGCQPVIIIGKATGVIGDTSDKTAERPMLTRSVVEQHSDSYVNQIGQIVDMENAELHYNSEWLDELKLDTIGELSDLFSVHEFINREKIKDRLAQGKRVSLRETLYPLLQGYDSFRVRADLELGGSDQWFNFNTARHIQKHYGQNPQDMITTESTLR